MGVFHSTNMMSSLKNDYGDRETSDQPGSPDSYSIEPVPQGLEQVVYPIYEEAFRLGVEAFSNPMRVNKFHRQLPHIIGTLEFQTSSHAGIVPCSQKIDDEDLITPHGKVFVHDGSSFLNFPESYNCSMEFEHNEHYHASSHMASRRNLMVQGKFRKTKSNIETFDLTAFEHDRQCHSHSSTDLQREAQLRVRQKELELRAETGPTQPLERIGDNTSKIHRRPYVAPEIRRVTERLLEEKDEEEEQSKDIAKKEKSDDNMDITDTDMTLSHMLFVKDESDSGTNRGSRSLKNRRKEEEKISDSHLVARVSSLGNFSGGLFEADGDIANALRSMENRRLSDSGMLVPVEDKVVSEEDNKSTKVWSRTSQDLKQLEKTLTDLQMHRATKNN